MTETKTFNGERYEFHTPWRTKPSAVSTAKDLRKKGWKARVVRKPKKLKLLGKWRWVIYAKKKRGKK